MGSYGFSIFFQGKHCRKPRFLSSNLRISCSRNEISENLHQIYQTLVIGQKHFIAGIGGTFRLRIPMGHGEMKIQLYTATVLTISYHHSILNCEAAAGVEALVVAIIAPRISDFGKWLAQPYNALWRNRTMPFGAGRDFWAGHFEAKKDLNI